MNRRSAAGNNPAMEQPTDAELLAQSREEPAVFAGVYERYATTIYRYATRRVGPSDAEALMAETFRIAFERRATYDTTRPIAAPVALRHHDEPRCPAPSHRTAAMAGAGAPRIRRRDGRRQQRPGR